MNKYIAIFGPTTSNKTGLAIHLAKYIYGRYKIGVELINTDSRKIYKGFKISQQLLYDDFIPNHLYSSESPREIITVTEFKEIVYEKIIQIHERKNLPILVGGSSLHLKAIIENWRKGKKSKSNNLHPNILLIGTHIHKHKLKKVLRDHVNNMFSRGLYQEFCDLFKRTKKAEISLKLLNQTLGYRQFLEYARINKIDPCKIPDNKMNKIKHWMVKDMAKFGYKQSLDCRRFNGIKMVEDFRKARSLVDNFLKFGNRKR